MHYDTTTTTTTTTTPTNPRLNASDETDLATPHQRDDHPRKTTHHLVGDIQRIMVRREADIRLLLSVRSESLHYRSDRQHDTRHSPDERVHLGCLHIVELLHSILDLTLVRSNVNNKHQRVVLLNLFHRRLRVQRSAFIRQHPPAINIPRRTRRWSGTRPSAAHAESISGGTWACGSVSASWVVGTSQRISACVMSASERPARQLSWRPWHLLLLCQLGLSPPPQS